MASLEKVRGDKTRYRIWFYDKDGRRKSIRLRDTNKKDAEKICTKVGDLVSAANSNSPPPADVSLWLEGCGQDLLDKLAANGLVRNQVRLPLKQMIDAVIEPHKSTLAKRSGQNIDQAITWLLKKFEPESDPRIITPEETTAWRSWMVKEGAAQSSIAGYVKKVKQIFKMAKKAGYIANNPFEDVVAGSMTNHERRKYAPVDDVLKVAALITDLQFRGVVLLGRFAGMRVPSETSKLRWIDVNFKDKFILINGVKTGNLRLMPFCTYTEDILLALYATREDDAELVFTDRDDDEENMGTQLKRHIKKAGVKEWGKPFQNLRVSCRNDLNRVLPHATVNAFMGHSSDVAEQHYDMVLSWHNSAARAAFQSGATVGAIVVQKPVPPASASTRRDAHESAFHSREIAIIENSPSNMQHPDYPQQGGNTPNNRRYICMFGDVVVQSPVRLPRSLERLIAKWPQLTFRKKRAIMVAAGLPVPKRGK